MRFILVLLFIVQAKFADSSFDKAVIYNLFDQIVEFNNDYCDRLDLITSPTVAAKIDRLNLARHNTDRINKNISHVRGVLDKSSSVFFFLESLLVIHLRSLVGEEEQMMSDYLSVIKNDNDVMNMNLVAPVDPICIEALKKFLGDQKNYLFTYEQEILSRDVDSFQAFSLIIKTTYDLILDKREIPESTLNLLRCAPSLWPILSGDATEFCSRDKCGVYRIVNCYIREFNCRTIIEAIKKIANNVPCPLWEKERFYTDSELYKAHIGYRKEIMVPPSLRANRNKKGRKSIVTIESLVEQGKWHHKMPVLFDYDSLKSPLEVAEVHEVDEPMEDSNAWIPAATIAHSKKKHVTKAKQKKKSRNRRVRKKPVDCAVSSDVALAEVVVEKQPEQEVTSQLTKAGQPKKLKPSEKRALNKAKNQSNFQELLNRSLQKAIDYSAIGAAGNRKFHSFKESTYQKRDDIHDRWQTMIDTIFDYEQFSTMKYKNFKTLWEHLGGQIGGEKSGGSHRTLIGPAGDIVGSIFTHHRSQTYGKSVQKYFTDALGYIGCSAR
jgi:hypothetical protein